MVAKVQDLQHYPSWPRLLSAPQAAAYLGTSKSSFERYDRQHIPAIRRGKGVKYDIYDLDIYIEKLKGNDQANDNASRVAAKEEAIKQDSLKNL